MKLPARLAVIGCLSALGEITWAACVETLTCRQVTACLLCTFAMPWIGFLNYAWFADEKKLYGRLLQTLASALGMVVGCSVVLYWMR